MSPDPVRESESRGDGRTSRRTLRIVHFCRKFSGLSETFIYEYVTATARRGAEVHVLTCIRENVDSRPFEPVHTVGWPAWWSARRLSHRLAGAIRRHPAEGSFWNVVQARLPKVVDRIRPDIIHAHFGPAAVAAMAASRGIPLVATFFGYDASRLSRDPYWRARYADLWRGAAAITVLSGAMRDELLRLGCPEDRVHIVRLGRDLGQLPFRLPNAPVRHFISVGRLTEKKGHLDVLEAFRMLRATEPTARLTLVGDGELRSEITRFVSVHGLEDAVMLRGELPNEAVVDEMARADAFILASRTAATGDAEGTPTVLIEAQALGLPCIATRHAGIPEMIPRANHAWLFEEGDVAAAADRLRRLATCCTADLREIALAGRRKVEDEYDVERSAEALSSLYDRVACRHPGARPAAARPASTAGRV